MVPATGASGAGCALAAAAKAAELSAVEPCSGTVSVKRPSSGMHSLRQASHEACSVKLASRASGPGAKALLTVRGTGSSTVPS